MRNVLLCIEILIVCRDLDSALPTARAEEETGTRIVNNATVDGKMIVVESFVHRTCGRSPPVSIVTLAEYGTALSAKTEANDYGSSLRGIDAETCISL